MTTVIFPDTLLSSSDFGDVDLMLSPSDFEAETEKCKKDFGPDFEPCYLRWDLIDSANGVYSSSSVAVDRGKHKLITLTAQAIWSELNGSFKLQDVDDDLDAYTNSLLSFTPINA